MVDRNLIRSLESDEFLTSEIEAAILGADATGIATIESEPDVELNKIVDGRVIRVTDDHVLVDVGFKSEGIIDVDEWEEDEPQPEIGQSVKVLVEDVEDGMSDEPYGMITLSKRKAEKIIAWQEMMKTVQDKRKPMAQAIVVINTLRRVETARAMAQMSRFLPIIRIRKIATMLARMIAITPPAAPPPTSNCSSDWM